MRVRRCHGFTVVEAVIAIILFGLVGQTVLGLLTASQRLFRSQAEHAALQGTLRAGALLLPAELRGLSGSDLLAIAPDQLTYRAMRLTGVACQVSPASVTLRQGLMYAYRSLVAGRDSLLLFVEGDLSRSDDDRWLAVPVTGAPAASACPDGSAALTLPAIVPTAAVSISPAVPVRGFEVMQLRLYQSGGQYWLGSRSVSGGEAQVQPALGPLASAGLRLAYARADGSTTANPTEVAFIRLVLQALTDGAVRGVAGALAVAGDSIAASVGLRNAE
jgi:hypothetical protein